MGARIIGKGGDAFRVTVTPDEPNRNHREKTFGPYSTASAAKGRATAHINEVNWRHDRDPITYTTKLERAVIWTEEPV